eukprot:scaffold5623_cov162-Isochrysis_galbana.AAC.2
MRRRSQLIARIATVDVPTRQKENEATRARGWLAGVRSAGTARNGGLPRHFAEGDEAAETSITHRRGNRSHGRLLVGSQGGQTQMVLVVLRGLAIQQVGADERRGEAAQHIGMLLAEGPFHRWSHLHVPAQLKRVWRFCKALCGWQLQV